MAELAARREVAGVVVLGSPTAEDLAALPRTDGGGVPFWLSSDEEGGRVQRLAALLGALPQASSLVGTPTNEVTDMYRAYGTAMVELGFAMAFAPVIDVGAGPGITTRSFSDDPEVVAEYGQAVVDGYVSAGLLPVLKHFPGHGRGSADSHVALSFTPDIEELRAVDLVPFEALVSSEVAVMVGHLVVPGLTDELPASLSPAAIDGLLRTELGFDGLVITDALNMNAIADRWGTGEAVRLALVAGADVAIVGSPAEVAPVLDHLESAVAGGTLTRAHIDDSVARVFEAKAADPCAALAA